MMPSNIHRIKSDLDYPIVATVRIAHQAKAVVLINAGTCIKRAFYDAFTIYLQSQGYTTVQYDYLGVGDSRPASLKSFRRGIYDWGAKDMHIVSNWIDGQFPRMRKMIVGHSIGGQIVGLMPTINSFEKVITIASSYGNYRNFEWRQRWNMRLSLNTIFPLMNWWFGYFPASRLGLGSDWPQGVAEEWRLWNTKYLSMKEWMNELGRRHYFREFHVPMTAFLFEDDTMATAKCIPHFQLDYPKATIRLENPEKYKLDALGHFKIFRKQSEPFWKEVVRELDQH